MVLSALSVSVGVVLVCPAFGVLVKELPSNCLGSPVGSRSAQLGCHGVLLEHGKSVDLGENVWPQLCVNKAADRHLAVQPERVAAQFHLLAIIQAQPKPLWIELA
jgi:hypothetical protein